MIQTTPFLIAVHEMRDAQIRWRSRPTAKLLALVRHYESEVDTRLKIEFRHTEEQPLPDVLIDLDDLVY